MPPAVEVKGPGAAEAQKLVGEGSPAQPDSGQVHTFEFDNSQGLYKLPTTKQTLTGYGATRDDAKQNLATWLETQRVAPRQQDSDVNLTLQHGLEAAVPSAAGALSINPLIAGAARAGGYLATRGIQAYLTPNEYQEQTAGQWPAVLGETVMQGVEGAAGALTATPLGQAIRPLGNKFFTGSTQGVQPTTNEQRLLGAGEPPTPTTPAVPPGPFQAGAELTGVPAYPRLSSVFKNWFTTLSDYFSMALLSAGRTTGLLQQGRVNLDAYSTQIAMDLTKNADPRTMARVLNQLLDTGAREVRPFQSGLWKAADARVLAETGGVVPTIQTTADINRLTETTALGGQPPQVMADLQKAIGRELEARPIEESFANREFKSTREQVAPGEVARTSESTTTQANARTSRTAESTGESTTLSDPTLSITEGTQGTTVNSTTMPLAGRLHTFDPTTGTFQEHITLGDAMELRSAIGNVIGGSGNPRSGLQDADIRVAKAWYRDLGVRIDDALTAIHPDLATMYKQARDATAEMYARMRAGTLLKTMQSLEDNPAALRDYFFRDGGLAQLDTLKDALKYIDRIPGTSVNGVQWFEANLQPRLRYQAMWDASNVDLLPGMSKPLDNLQKAASGNADIQALIKNKELVSLRPKALEQLRQNLGEEQFNTLMGSESIAKKFLDLDSALQANAGFKDSQHIYIMMLQTGGLSRMSNAIGGSLGTAIGLGGNHLLGGNPTMNVIAGIGGGATLLFAPAVINYLATKPQLFESLILGIKSGNVPYVTRLASQIGVSAARYGVQQALRTGEPIPSSQVRGPVSTSPTGTPTIPGGPAPQSPGQ